MLTESELHCCIPVCYSGSPWKSSSPGNDRRDKNNNQKFNQSNKKSNISGLYLSGVFFYLSASDFIFILIVVILTNCWLILGQLWEMANGQKRNFVLKTPEDKEGQTWRESGETLLRTNLGQSRSVDTVDVRFGLRFNLSVEGFVADGTVY